MEKLIYGLWRAPDQAADALAVHLLDEVAPALLGLGGGRDLAGLRVNVEAPEAGAMRWGVGNDGALLSAAVDVWLTSLDVRGPVEAALAATGVTVHGYLVTESVPLAYERIDWPLGARSPGVSLLTFFPQRDGISDEEFFSVWHGEQTPMTFELHPVTVYLRNAVARPITPAAPPFRGIVEESVPSVEHLVDLDRFYSAGGDRHELNRRLARSMELHERFTDMDELEAVPCAEYLFRVVST